MPEVVLPPALLALFPGVPRRHRVAATSVAAALDAVDALHPGIADRIRDTTPRIRRHIKVFVRGERAGLDTHLDAEDEVIVLTAISGG